MNPADPPVNTRSSRRSGAQHGGHGSRRRADRTRSKTDFYAQALDRTERVDLVDAADVAGLDQEIALLRLRLRRLLVEQPDDVTLTMRTIALLVRAVGAAAHLTSADTTEMLDSVSANLGGVLSLLNDEEDEEANG